MSQMLRRSRSRVSAIGAGIALVVGVLAAGLVTAVPAGAAPIVYVAPSGSGGGSCATPDFNTISAAVTAAVTGETINVCAGTYNEMVTVSAVPVTLNATTTPVIVNATGQPEGMVIKGAAAAGTVVQGITVNNAQGEGILVEGTSGVTIQNNIVSGNDLACIPQTGANDCGEGIHLEAVTNSTVSRNTSESNSGGILLDDGVPPNSIGAGALGGPTAYYGPTSGNIVLNNIVVNNIWDCGITMPSHNSLAAPGGPTQPGGGRRLRQHRLGQRVPEQRHGRRGWLGRPDRSAVPRYRRLRQHHHG